MPDADRYRVTLFDASANLLFDVQTTDTSATLPDSLHIVPGRSYLWKVEARTAWDRWAASELIEFRAMPVADHDGAPLGAISAVRSQSRDSLRLIAAGLSDSALRLEARARPGELREALSSTLALAVQGPSVARAAALELAGRLAAAHQSAWHDPFLVRLVARFVEWSPDRRAAKVTADSIRRAGITVFSRDGAMAAIAVWRDALSRAIAIGDSAGMAATFGNIGSGFLRSNALDSAQHYLERSRALAAASGNLPVEANATSELGGVSEQRNDPVGARQHYARAISLRQATGDTRGLAADYNNLGGLAQQLGDLDGARHDFEAALDLNRRDGHDAYAATNLVNLAGLAALHGDFARAERLYRAAVAAWRPREQWADVADGMRGLGSLEMRRGDYPAAEADLIEARALYDRTGPIADALAVGRMLADTRAAMGNLQGALDELRRDQSSADSGQVPYDVRAGITLAQADLAVRLNQRPEAERLYAAATQLFDRAGSRGGAADAQQGEAMLLVDQGGAARAQGLLDAALRTELDLGNQRAAGLTRLWLGELSLQRGDTVAARRGMSQAAADLDHAGDPVAAAAAIGQQAGLEASAGLPARAESLYRAAIRRVGTRAAPDIAWRLHAGLAGVRRDRGASDEAAREYRTSIAEIEESGRSLALAERRSGFLTDKWDVYVQLALLESKRGHVVAAFDVSERARASEMLEMLSQGRVTAPTDTAAALVTQEQDLRRRIGELSTALSGGSDGAQPVRGPDVARTTAVTREALLQAQASYSELLLQIREHAPRHAALISRATASWNDVALALAPDQALIEYLVSDANALAFVVTRDSVAVVNLDVSRRELTGLIDVARGTLQPRGSPRLDSLWRAPLRQLHRHLFEPIEATGLLVGKTQLIMVPHVELHYLPFAALLDGSGAGRFLVERYQVTVTPSASVWLALGQRPRSQASAGMLAFAPRPNALPASRQEVAAIARFGGSDARVLVGSSATEAAFRRDAPGKRVIHLATYGVLNKQNPLFSFVELAAGGGEDGRLEVHEVFGLHLSADLVVLSACQTGLGSGAITDVPAGDDWIGLARAFLSAGAARVVASLWPVQDRATGTLMERFYEGYTRSNDASSALVAAQRAMLAVPATASPYFWAGFELVGGR